MDKIISFPQMGNYYVPIKYLFSHITEYKILDSPKITNKTVELGSKYSPDFVCTPFKYTLGTLLENLEMGSNTLIQLGGGCRYGYYAELQDQIIKDLGYDFKLYNLVTQGKASAKRIYKIMKEIDNNINVFKSLYYLFITIKMVKYMDQIDDYIRKDIGFEEESGSFKKELDNMLKEFSHVKGYFNLRKVYKKYKKIFKNIKINKPDNCMKVGVIGELYTVMERYANYDIEYELAKKNIEVTRFTNATYLLFKKGKAVKKYLKSLNNIKYRMGADAVDNIYYAKYLCEKKFDGIIHIKSSFCTPEIGNMSIINNICKSYSVPVIFFSFDTNTSKVGIETRLEAFYDMLEMRKNNE